MNNGNDGPETGLVVVDETQGEDAKLVGHEDLSGDRLSTPQPPSFGRGSLVRLLLVLVGVIMLGYIFTSSMCGGKTAVAKQPDVVKDFKPVSNRFATQSFAAELAKLKAMQPGDRGPYINKNFPRLHEDVVYYLRQNGKLNQQQRVESVEFFFGSANSVSSETGDSGLKEGKFTDQLIARVKVVGNDTPMDVIVYCLNGTFDLPNDLQSLGSREPRQQFTILAGEGLTDHVAMATAIDLAERFDLKIYRERVVEGNLISPEEARKINTDEIKVIVFVVKDDSFDLIKMTFTPSPKRRGQ